MSDIPFEKLIKEYSLAEVEELYRNGRVSQDDYEKYCDLWRNSSFRFSDEKIAYQRDVSRTTS